MQCSCDMLIALLSSQFTDKLVFIYVTFFSSFFPSFSLSLYCHTKFNWDEQGERETV